jgi:hypothetical protein
VCDVCATPSLIRTGAPTSVKALLLTLQRIPAKRLPLPGGARFNVRQLHQSSRALDANGFLMASEGLAK